MMKTLLNVLEQLDACVVLDSKFPIESYAKIDMSVNNPELNNQILVTPEAHEKFIQQYLNERDALIAWGGYLEVRNLYRRSSLFQQENNRERNIHLGIDFWTKEDTTVLAALEGRVHSFRNNLGLGNYGPTIILEHKIDGIKFFTLYGHLSLKSIHSLRVGFKFEAGQPIGSLGISSVNDDYAPHLHFQIIKDIQYRDGDYPGVCHAEDLTLFMSNCPNPNRLLKIPE